MARDPLLKAADGFVALAQSWNGFAAQEFKRLASRIDRERPMTVADASQAAARATLVAWLGFVGLANEMLDAVTTITTVPAVQVTVRGKARRSASVRQLRLADGAFAGGPTVELKSEPFFDPAELGPRCVAFTMTLELVAPTGKYRVPVEIVAPDGSVEVEFVVVEVP